MSRAPLGPHGAWLELAWEEPQLISQVQLTFDSGFQRELTLSASTSVNTGIIRAPQPETVKMYAIQYQAGNGEEWIELARAGRNHQRLRRHKFRTVSAKRVRILVQETHGDALARIYEVRCYA